MAELHERYGDVVRFGPRMLSFAHPDAVKDIFSSQDPFVKVSLLIFSPRRGIAGNNADESSPNTML